MKRILTAAGILILLALAGWFTYRVNRRLRGMEARIAEMNTQVNEATQLAKEQAVAVSAASQRATEAAERAEVAAQGRIEAEQQKQLAQAGQQQAETAARDAATKTQQAQEQLEALRKQRQEEFDQMQRALSKLVETKRTTNGLVMVLPDSVFKFSFDSADLTQKNRELLSRIAGILLVSKGYGLSVFGYTDDVGTREYNQKLSERRAESVRSYLVSAGLDSSIVNTKGFGKNNPLVQGDTPEARARNRRVEIALTDSEIKYVGEVN